jgi:hypothetical protein
MIAPSFCRRVYVSLLVTHTDATAGPSRAKGTIVESDADAVWNACERTLCVFFVLRSEEPERPRHDSSVRIAFVRLGTLLAVGVTIDSFRREPVTP